jgi:hypothetical protein
MVMKSHREELLTPRGRFVDVGELARQDHFVSAPFNPILLAGKSKVRPLDHSHPSPDIFSLRSYHLRSLSREQPSVKIGDLVHQFTVIAEVLAQIIVDELPQPDAKKLIPPVNLGGVAGGAKYISHGILFKFAIDSAQLYGGDEFAMKATQHEIKGLTAYINYSLNSRFPNTLHFPLMTVIGTHFFHVTRAQAVIHVLRTVHRLQGLSAQCHVYSACGLQHCAFLLHQLRRNCSARLIKSTDRVRLGGRGQDAAQKVQGDERAHE